tara:strand:+ start:2882 stop:3484 length:603 start_codon:yes stop_codon:yes gene_type:complete
MAYLGTQPNDVKKNTGLYTPSEILQLTKDGSWGGSLELIAEETISGTVSSVDFTSIQENRYDIHFLTIQQLEASSGGSNYITIRFYESGVLETATVYQFANQIGTASGSFSERKSTGLANIELGVQTNVSEIANSYAYFYNLGNSSKYSFCTSQGFGEASVQMGFGGGVLPQASVVDGIQVAHQSSFDTGTIKLFGVKQI